MALGNAGARLSSNHIPKTATFTRYYDGHCDIEYDTEITDDPVDPAELVAGLNKFAKGARRIAAPDPGQEEGIQVLRTMLANWADEKKALVAELQDLRTERGVELNLVIMNKCKDPLQRDFYIRMARRFGWSRNVLIHQSENQSYQKSLLEQL